jgi:hypothetical protein
MQSATRRTWRGLPPPELRRVVLDEDICWKLIGELQSSGRADSEREPYIRDVVHRWLHRIEVQRPGERRFYSPVRPRKAAAKAVAIVGGADV